MVCRAEGTTRAKEGYDITLALDASSCHLFDASGKAFRRLVEIEM